MMNESLVCVSPEKDIYCQGHLVKDKVYYNVETHYGGKDNKGQVYINGWWFSRLCFITLDEWRDKRLSRIL